MSDQVAPNGSKLMYPRKLTRGNQVIVVANSRAQLEYERAGFTDAAGTSLLKLIYPRTVKNQQGKVLVASCAEAYLSLLNDGFADVIATLG